MAAKEEQRALIRVLWSEGVSGADIYRRLCVQYGESVLSRRSVYEWIEKFKEGRTSVTQEEGAGRPSTSTTVDNIERARELLLLDRRVTVDCVARQLRISHGSAYSIIHDRLGFRNVCARWEPRLLTEEHKQKRLDVCRHNLDLYSREGEAFLSRIITGDETWIHYQSKPESKDQIMEWTRSQKRKKFKSQASDEKLLVLTLFWDAQGPILEHYQEKGSPVDSARYSEILARDLKPTIQTKRTGLLSEGVVFLHTRLHAAPRTVDALQKLSFQVLEHPPYSPDLAPSNYHLFGPLKEALKGRRLTCDEDAKAAVHSWLADQPETFFKEGIRKLVDRWTKCIEKQGDYVDNEYES